MENTNISTQQQVSEIMRQMLTQAQTARQYFTNDQIKEMTRKASAEVHLVHQQTQNQRYGSSHIGATAFFFSSRRRHTRYIGDWSSDVCSSDLFRTNADSARGRENQFAIISPTTHCLSETLTDHTFVGSRDMGDARFDHFGIYLRWFDHWLKGADNGVTKMPKLQIYVMGKNQWRAENEWPFARTRFTNYYLHSDGQANSRFGTGVLTDGAPGGEASDSYTYDPRVP